MTIRLKTVNERLDYDIDYSKVLSNGEHIQTSIWTVPAPLDEDGTSNSNTAAKVWLKDGVLGSDYQITNKITTTDGRVFERAFTLRIVATRN